MNEAEASIHFLQQAVSNQVSEEQVPLKICRGKDDITTFFKVNLILLVSIKYSSENMMP